MPLGLAESLGVTLALCTTLSVLAYWKKVLSADGAFAAFGVGVVIGVWGDVTWLLLLLFFLLSSFLATRYRFALKEAMGVQEGARGERGATNVLANGTAPMAVALLAVLNLPSFPKDVAGLVFLSALAVAGADTLASEIGVLSPRARLITTFKRVPSGTDGGISLLGEASALAASLFTALFGWLVLFYLAGAAGLTTSLPSGAHIWIPVVVGFVGCQIDSVLGATLESRGILTKRSVNLVSTSFGAFLAYVFLVVV